MVAKENNLIKGSAKVGSRPTHCRLSFNLLSPEDPTRAYECNARAVAPGVRLRRTSASGDSSPSDLEFDLGELT